MRRKTWYEMTATMMGIGTFPKMPGTLGAAAALAFFLLTGYDNIPMIIAVAVIGAIASGRYAAAVSRDDPDEVVIDKAAGFFVSVWGLGRNFAVVAFFLFRMVGILKPFPLRLAGRLPSGIGMMADDICGGIMVNLLLRGLETLFFGGGLEAAFKFIGIGGGT